jgi:hypothetical protein
MPGKFIKNTGFWLTYKIGNILSFWNIVASGIIKFLMKDHAKGG